MTKQECIGHIAPILKTEGFSRIKNRWHKRKGDVIFCLEIQGSNFGKDVYYCNIYLAVDGYYDGEFPQEWQIEHRVFATKNEQQNVHPDLILQKLEEYINNLSSAEKIKAKFKKDKNFQYDVLYNEFRKFCER